MRGFYKKKGLSPIIATTILVAIALILAVIIFLWARSFISEKTQKFDEPVENACDRIDFSAEADTITTPGSIIVNIANHGDIAIYGLEYHAGSFGSVDVKTQEGTSIGQGGVGSFTFEGYNGETDVKVVPIIVGESGTVKKAYTCDVKYGKDVVFS